jgi:hypothetical protein
VQQHLLVPDKKPALVCLAFKCSSEGGTIVTTKNNCGEMLLFFWFLISGFEAL